MNSRARRKEETGKKKRNERKRQRQRHKHRKSKHTTKRNKKKKNERKRDGKKLHTAFLTSLGNRDKNTDTPITLTQTRPDLHILLSECTILGSYCFPYLRNRDKNKDTPIALSQTRYTQDLLTYTHSRVNASSCESSRMLLHADNPQQKPGYGHTHRW